MTEGYGVLQPRVGVDVVSGNRTTFAKVFSGHVGVDPYTTAVSDVYQDLFHEGSYVGKGIYDIDAFEAALANRVPENALLSHDLFEGVYARAGLCTDIHLIDDYPPQYLAFAARQHRWVRGDWQIMRWLWRTVPDATRHPVPNTLPVIARWKILDNLRRSLLPIALVALLAAGWTILPGSALLWSVLAVLVLAFPAYVQVARSLGSRVRGVRVRDHIAAERDTLVTSARQSFLSATFLAHQACLMADAIGRTLWRLLVSGRRRLEWVSAYQVGRVNPPARAGASADVGRAGARDCRRRSRRGRRPGAASPRAADDRAVDRLASHRVRDRPASVATRQALGPRNASSCARSRGRRGGSSRTSSDLPTIGWFPTTIRRIARSSSRIARPRPTSACS